MKNSFPQLKMYIFYCYGLLNIASRLEQKSKAKQFLKVTKAAKVLLSSTLDNFYLSILANCGSPQGLICISLKTLGYIRFRQWQVHLWVCVEGVEDFICVFIVYLTLVQPENEAFINICLIWKLSTLICKFIVTSTNLHQTKGKAYRFPLHRISLSSLVYNNKVTSRIYNNKVTSGMNVCVFVCVREAI